MEEVGEVGAVVVVVVEYFVRFAIVVVERLPVIAPQEGVAVDARLAMVVTVVMVALPAVWFGRWAASLVVVVVAGPLPMVVVVCAALDEGADPVVSNLAA